MKVNKKSNLGMNDVNENIMPTVNEIEEKMKYLSEKYDIDFKFGFPEITDIDLLNGPGDPPQYDDF